ncbi:hypothetical protein GGH13_000931 [Coemansia sp. S155-1]|nr:hypothetical protein GGH13_000931 [Coemansia sp. S155-1]
MRVNNPDNPLHLLAGEIWIRVHVCTIYRGQALQQLSTKPYEGCAFPQVRELTLDLVTDLSYNKGGEDLPPDADANILAFAQRIKEMAPRVSKVYLGIPCKSGDSATGSDEHMRFLLSNLSSLTHRTLLTTNCEQLVTCPGLVPACKLMCINIDIRDDPSPVLQLARLCAPTLRTIDIRFYEEVDTSGLIRDTGDGEYVKYPYVRSLAMQFGGIVVSQRFTFKGAVPFPNLRRLVLNSGYPFSDDVLFRGNAATLEYLKLQLTVGVVSYFTHHNVFTSTSHPKLYYVNIHLPRSHSPDQFVEANSCLQFGLGIAPGASVRRIVGYELADKVIPQNTSLLGRYGNIQYLSIPNTSLSFWTVITLIKSLPLLSDLHTGPPLVVLGPPGVKEEKLPKYVQATYAPIKKRFRCWYISSGQYTRQLATSVLLLALICPSFTHVAAAESTNQRKFIEAIEWQLAMPEFEEYARRLRLQFYGNLKKIK